MMELLPILWGFVVGLVFSTVGAAGGILAGVGHISLFGIKDANLVKFYNQFLVVVSPAVSLPIYLRHRRVVLIIAMALGLGSLVGSLIGSTLSYHYLKGLKEYKTLFGILTILIGTKVIYDTFRFVKVEKARELKTRIAGIKVELKQNGQKVVINLINPFLAGMFISIVSSAMGVGGGFLVVPYMLIVLRLIAYYVPGTAVLVVLIATFVSLANYYKMGVSPEWSFLLKEMLGVWVGSGVGPHLSRIMGERPLRLAIGFLLLLLGFAYTFRLL